MFSYILFLIFSLSSLHAENISQLTKKLKLYGGMKAKNQWERVFSSERHLIRYKLDKIAPQQREALKAHLIEHAADSKHPTVSGV